jgi:hypothetical protein
MGGTDGDNVTSIASTTVQVSIEAGFLRSVSSMVKVWLASARPLVL